MVSKYDLFSKVPILRKFWLYPYSIKTVILPRTFKNRMI
ncbi:hypothetical protein DFQ12_0761 [Sphingobacterium detergens]|uniref:Uncharacterized protein n=1 Tax=Sphingobacterium detergens TaxID=1145106 RepID=A0A420BGU9_SPHD1|nr:hypothetical protein DFQ12_0761 [Sphingobacterium detergens]